MTPDFRVTPSYGALAVVPLTDRAREFAARTSGSFLRFLRAAHDAGLVVA